ncbi:MAG TPA: hypothetical protein VMH41_17110 [Mycobacteriales bacterium]|jgi:hypothetical protein|nr:hypothetical protein [Mycobacteriales bacterium]
MEDGSTALLSLLVIVAAHSRFITGRMMPTRKTEDLLLGSWELVQQLEWRDEEEWPLARAQAQRWVPPRGLPPQCRHA